MRPAVRKHLVVTFRREFEKRHTQFSLLKLPPGGSVKAWERQVSPHLVFFVVLSVFRNEDQFAIEIAWNEHRELPWMSFGDFKVDAPSWRERLGCLWEQEGDEPIWDAAPEVGIAREARFEAMGRGETGSFPPPPDVDVVIPRIVPLVDDSLHKFEQYGLPLFKQVAEYRGLHDVF
jgi:hypothetical protein